MEEGTRELLLRRRRIRMSPPWVLTIAFLVLGILWVSVTDELLYWLVKDPQEQARIQSSKGWIFVGVTAVFLFIASYRIFDRLRRTMALVDSILDSVADGILVLEAATGSVVEANPAAAEMLRVARAELIGMDGPAFSRRFRVSYEDGRLVPPEQFVSQRARTGTMPPRYTALLHRGDGSRLFIDSSAAPVFSPETGEVALVVSVMRDVTVERELLRLRDDFLSTIAHELRTPMTLIRMATQRALRGGPSAQAGLQAVERATIRMHRIVEELLEAVRVRVGDLPVQPNWTDLLPLLHNRLQEFAGRSAKHRLTLDCEPADAQLLLWTDAQYVDQVVTQLLDNAIRYSPAGGQIRVSVRGGPERVEVSVIDHGIGIPPDRQPHVFERYFRGQRNTTSDYGGMGIGLYVAKAKVEALGGRIGFVSQQGKGSRFWFSLPRFEQPRLETRPEPLSQWPTVH